MSSSINPTSNTSPLIPSYLRHKTQQNSHLISPSFETKTTSPLSFTSTSSESLDPDQVLSILKIFWDATNGPTWLYSSGWWKNSCYCNWFGIRCDDENGNKCNSNILSIGITFNQMSGYLPSEIGLLTTLTNLNLDTNAISGTIPTQIGNLTSLTQINLSYNDFHGTIPTQLALLFELIYIDFSSNYLEGKIPSEFSKLSNLIELELSNNYLFGIIPSYLNSLTQLKILYLRGNSFFIFPSDLYKSKSLQKIILSDNRLIGTIATEIGNLKTLTVIDFSDNFLNGSIPTQIGLLSKLEDFRLYNNFISGSLPSELGYLKLIQNLFVDRNFLFGTIPNEIVYMSKLVILDASSNFITGEFPPNIQRMTNLNHLVFVNNQLNGTLPSELALLYCDYIKLDSNNFTGQIPSLNYRLSVLSLDYNQFTGTFPNLEGMRSLSYLSLKGNSLGGTLPPQINQMFNLIYLDLSENYLEGTVPPLSDLSSLNILNMSYNRFKGTIPNFDHLYELELLDLSSNQLSGQIPIILIQKVNLRVIILSNNEITGSIPNVFSHFHSLSVLDFSCNQLSGVFPTTLLNLPYLNSINLRSNQLIGTLPYTFFSLRTLIYCNLAYNKIEGTIPSFISNSFLRELYLAGNRFTGKIPSSLANNPKLSIFEVENNYLNGTVPTELALATSLMNINVAGNMLSGSISSDILLLPNLELLQISSNRFDFDLMDTPLSHQPNYTALLSGNSFPCPLPKWCDSWEQGGNAACVPCVSEKKDYTTGIVSIVGGLSGAVLILLIISFIFYYKYKIQKKRYQINSNDIELVKLIGEGASGQVFEGRWKQTTIVAVKVLKSSRCTYENFQNFKKEAKLLSKLSPHPNIVQFLGMIDIKYQKSNNKNEEELVDNRREDKGSEEDSIRREEGEGVEEIGFQIVTEYLSHGSLHSFLSSCYTPSKICSEIQFVYTLSKGIAAGMNHLSRANIVHKDLAARNILLHHTTPKIADFGLSCVKHPEKIPVRWSAPELFLNGNASIKSDVWSYGMVLYEIVTSCKEIPYWHLNNREVKENVLKGYRLPKTYFCPSEIYEIIFICWSEKPESRPSFEEVFLRLDSEQSIWENENPSSYLETQRESIKLSSSGNLFGFANLGSFLKKGKDVQEYDNVSSLSNYSSLKTYD